MSGERRVVLAFDPGYSATGWCAFGVPEGFGSQDLTERVGWLTGAGALRPAAKAQPLALAQLWSAVTNVIDAGRPRLIAVETTYAGLYADRRRRQRMGKGAMNAGAMRLHSAAWGVVLALAGALPDVEVQQVNVTLPKATRSDLVVRACERAGVPVPSSPHARDAVWVGCAADWRSLYGR